MTFYDMTFYDISLHNIYEMIFDFITFYDRILTELKQSMAGNR